MTTFYDDIDRSEFIQRASIIPARIGYKPGYESLSGRAEANLLPSMGEDVDLETLFTFPAIISNTRVDSYFTRMSPRTLNGFVRSLKEGVPFLDSHNTFRLPIGRSYNGYKDESRGLSEAVGYFFIRKGINLGGGHSYATTNDYATAIDSRIITAVSVGFTGGEWSCDICGNDYWSEDCTHVAGMTYGDQTATVTIDGANLAEVSAVWEGATPGATIQKALLAQEAGVLTQTQVRVLSDRFGVQLPPKSKAVPVRSEGMKKRIAEDVVTADAGQAEDVVTADAGQADAGQAEDVVTADAGQADAGQAEDVVTADAGQADAGQAEDVVTADPELIADYERALSAMREAFGEDVETLGEGVARLIAEAGGLREAAGSLRSEVARLTDLAAIGETYRADLIAETLSEGVRVQGVNFPEDAYKALLQGAGIPQIKAIRASFTIQTEGVLPSGAQVKTPAKGNERAKKNVPNAAFRG